MWVKSSLSFANGNCVECRWRKSSHSGSIGDCVEVGGRVQVRDSQDRDGPVLAFSATAWEVFTAQLKRAW
jgi:hypothetical protein